MNASAWLLLLVLLLGGAGVALWFRAEGAPPSVQAPEALLVGRSGADLTVALSDADSGLRSLRVSLVDADGESALLEESYPGNLISGGLRTEHDVEVRLPAERLRGMRGQATIRITARDWSWRDLLAGNQAVREIPLTVDLEPPRLAVETGLTYVKQGGAGAVAYRVSEATAFDGVQVGDHRYRGHPRPGAASPRERIALFAVPSELDTDVEIRVLARDAAGNEATARWPVVVKPRAMPEGNVSLGQSFLENVVPRLVSGDPGDDLAAAFHDVNTRVRAANEARIRELLAASDEAEPLFDGHLEQLANSQVTSRFAERRTYFVEGQPVSKAVHYGYDLASTSAADVTAAADGRVVHAGDLGIYGGCVLLDHGLGLATLYGHLSRIDVEVGDLVGRGDTLGLSGATGLAGGDHLHFAVLVGDTYVDPLEWWDAKWVESHVKSRFLSAAP